MHPIEHLRYVARAQGVDAAALVEESAHALGSLGFDPAGLVVACRRIVERHPFTGPLWWLSANLSTSAEPLEAVWELAGRIRNDRTAAQLAAELPDDAVVATVGAPDVIAGGLIRRGDVRVIALDSQHTATSFVRRLERHDVDYEPVDAAAAAAVAAAAEVSLVEALALDAERIIVPLGSATLAACATAADRPVWLVAGVGRRLPSSFIDAMVERIEAATADVDPWDLDVEVLPARLVTDVVGPLGRMPMGPPAAAPECPPAPELLRTSPI